MRCKTAIASSQTQAALVEQGGVFRAHIAPVPRLVGDAGHAFRLLGVAQDKAILLRVLAQPAEGGGVGKASVKGGVLRAVQVGGKAAVVLRAARRVDDDSGLFPGGSFAQALLR